MKDLIGLRTGAWCWSLWVWSRLFPAKQDHPEIQHKNNIGLYRDDGLAVFKNTSDQENGNIRKDFHKLFKKHKLEIIAKCNLTNVDYLDVTLDLVSGTFKPYRKPDNENQLRPRPFEPPKEHHQTNTPLNPNPVIEPVLQRRNLQRSCYPLSRCTPEIRTPPQTGIYTNTKTKPTIEKSETSDYMVQSTIRQNRRYKHRQIFPRPPDKTLPKRT